MEEDCREDASAANSNDGGWAESVDPAHNRVIYYASLRGALPQQSAPKRARSSSAEEGRALRGAGRGRGEVARRPPPPNFFFAVRIDDEDVVCNAKTLQRYLVDEEARLWPTTNIITNPGTRSNDDATVQKAEDQDRAATSLTTSNGAGDKSKRGLGRYMIDVSNKLHVTLFVVCAPTPDLVARTQALCSAWAADLRSRPAAAISSFEMKVESVRCFNKGRGQFVLWAGIEDPGPLERLARDLHSWFVQHEPSLLQSIKWTPFTPHATLLKVRSFGRGQGGSGGHDSSPGARVLRILRPPLPPQPVVEPTPSPQQHPEQEQDCVEGEVIVYQGRPHQDNNSNASNDNSANTNDNSANVSGGERANRGGGRRGGWQGGAGRSGGRKRNDHEVVDQGRRFGRQMVESIELLAMQGCETVDERGRGGYPVYGRVFLDSSRSEYLDRSWEPPHPRAARGEEVAVADQEEKEEEPTA